MNAALRLFRKNGILSEEDVRVIRDKYNNGFLVHLQPAIGTNNEVLFRTAEYLAAGYFHKSMIPGINHNSAKITFRYKSWVELTFGTKSELCLYFGTKMINQLFCVICRPRMAEAMENTSSCRQLVRDEERAVMIDFSQ